ncbi:MAG TPA: type II secretion system F family protein [Candidatus Tumulicola sp.]|nr:type II secretion system F family protein [Candidatus Tumulicola sp.]
MLLYYAGRTIEGTRVRGSIEAATRETALGHLRSRAVFVTTLETAATVRGAWTRLGIMLGRDAVPPAAFYRSFGTLIAAGIPVRRALETLIRQTDGGFAEVLSSIAADVENGSALSKAMELHPHEFSRIAIAIVRAGETGGTLDEALQVLAELEERDRGLRKRLSAALAYPIAVVVAASGLVAFLLVNTMPSFAAMFSAMHVALPLPTRVLIAIGVRLQDPRSWIAAAAFAASIAVAARRLKESDSPLAALADRARLRSPVLGGVIAKTAAARFARTLGSLLRAGVDVVLALDAAAGVVDGFVYRSGLTAVDRALRRGETLTSAFAASGLFDATFLQLVRAGEESGGLDPMLLRLAHYYELDVETALATLTTVLEPALICILGIVIGTIVASIIIPLYTMIGNIQ